MAFVSSMCCMAQEYGKTARIRDTETPTQNGKAIIEVFGNFLFGIGEDNTDRGFTLERCYLGYEYRLGNSLTIKGVMDFGKSANLNDHHRIAFIKNAMVSWQTGGLTLSGGLIPTTQFHFQEHFWGCRHIRKSFQDEYTFGSSADLGVSASYKFADWICTDLIVVNGEGYKKIQNNGGLNYGVGVTLTPAKGLYIRLYGGLNENKGLGKKNTANVAAFVGYRHKRFALGAEYNYMTNTSGVEDADQGGYSLYATANLLKDISLLVRLDDLYSNILEDAKLVLGAQFKLGKHVELAPNLRIDIPKAEGTRNHYSAYLTCKFSL